jgi:RNA polymerase sigma-70 factor, ECF subfamily
MEAKELTMSYYANSAGVLYPQEWTWTVDSNLDSPQVERMVAAARSGDDSAFGWLASFYRSAAERVAQQILRTEEAAADAVQESLIKAHRAMDRFQDGNFRSWLLRIVTNTCYDHLRRQKRRATLSLDELTEANGVDYFAPAESTDPSPEQITLHNEGMRLLLDAIDGLPAWHRNVVMLVDVQGYDYNEAAAILSLPLGTVKSRLSRARSALRDELVRSGVVAPKLM